MATSTTPHVAPGPGAGAFTRTSSGLVRQVGTLDTFFYGLMQIAVAYVVFIIASWYLYPGASMEWSTLITLVGALGLGLVYALFSSVYPRSGGEYVFLSRTAHPGIGFVCSFLVTFWQCFYFGINGAFLALYGLAPMFQTLGIQENNQTLTDIGNFFTKHWGVFLTGLVVCLFFAFVQYRGLKIYFNVQKWGGLLALISIAVTLLVLVLGATGALDFHKHFDQLAGAGAYDKVIADAQKSGTDLSPSTALGPTLNFMIWPAFSLFFAILSVSFNGEIKNVRRGQLIGICSAMVVSASILVAIMALGRAGVGSKFLLASSSVDNFPLATAPFINVFAAITANNALVTVLVNMWIILIMAFVAGTTLVYSSRAMLAWGIDGVAPERLSTVSSKHHTPGLAIAVCTVIALTCLAFYAFTDLLAILSGLAGMGIAFFVTCVVGIFFPWRKRDTFESSPAALRVGRIPLITIAGTIGAAFLGFIIYRTYVDDAYAANSTTSIITNFAMIGVAILWYLVARAVRRRGGVDMERRFAEIPVE